MAKKLKIEKGKRREKWNIFSSKDVFDSSVLSDSRIEIFSNKRLVLEGCLGILEYNENYLKLRISKGALVLEGLDFDIISFELGTMIIGGDFLRLEFVV